MTTLNLSEEETHLLKLILNITLQHHNTWTFYPVDDNTVVIANDVMRLLSIVNRAEEKSKGENITWASLN